jgi:hypothetical protein
MTLSLIKAPASDTDIAEMSFECLELNYLKGLDAVEDIERKIFLLQQELSGWDYHNRVFGAELNYRLALQQEADGALRDLQYTFE